MQAAQENTFGLWGALMGQATFVVHAAGWLEGGLSFGYEKFLNDVESLQMLAELCTRPGATENDLALDALAEVAPGGHFFAAAHTMARYEQAFYPPLLSDLSNFGTWEANGAQTSGQRATALWQRVLADFQPPSHGAEAADRLAPFIAARTAAGGAPVLD
jgi:trimethylamine--corrinoid protein Co-methyltransferase